MMPLLRTTKAAEWHIHFLIIDKKISSRRELFNFHSIRHEILPGIFPDRIDARSSEKKHSDADFFDNM